jgi:hypothetical protein
MLAGGIAVLTVAALTAQAAAQTAQSAVPNFQSSPGVWTHPFGGEFPPVQGSALPVREDPRHPFISPVQSFRFGDLSNPNLKQWVKDAMKKDIEEIEGGKIQFSANSSCMPAGMPMFDLLPGPFYIAQTPTKVLMLEEQGPNMRQIYLNVPHSPNVKPSWYGESVGRYVGDSLMVDTIGINTKTVVDSFRTPHTEKLHVTERWHLIEGGNMLQVDITVDDPDTFNRPWRTYQRYQRSRRAFEEDICAENNTNLFDYHIPVANKPDF